MRTTLLAVIVAAAAALPSSYANATIAPEAVPLLASDLATLQGRAGVIQQRGTHEREDLQARQPELGDEGAARPAL